MREFRHFCLSLWVAIFAVGPAVGADADLLVGSWNGKMQTPNGAITFVMRFEQSASGELKGTLSIPEQGAEAPISDIKLANGQLTLKVPAGGAVYSATYADATFVGTWSQGGPDQPLTLTRGEFAMPALKIPPESFARLAGHWQGTLTATAPQGQKVDIEIVLRFENDVTGGTVGFVDSPSQNTKGRPITETQLSGDKLVVKIGSIGAQYDADLSGKTLIGRWKQGTTDLPLTLTHK